MTHNNTIFTGTLEALEALERRWTAEYEAMPEDEPQWLHKPKESALWALCQLRDRISRRREAERRA